MHSARKNRQHWSFSSIHDTKNNIITISSSHECTFHHILFNQQCSPHQNHTLAVSLASVAKISSEIDRTYFADLDCVHRQALTMIVTPDNLEVITSFWLQKEPLFGEQLRKQIECSFPQVSWIYRELLSSAWTHTMTPIHRT